MALMNMVSSNINQWTVLAAMIPVVYSLSQGHVAAVPFDGMHRHEILLTILQSLLGMVLLLNMRYTRGEAAVHLRPLVRSSSWCPTCARRCICVYGVAHRGWASSRSSRTAAAPRPSPPSPASGGATRGRAADAA